MELFNQEQQEPTILVVDDNQDAALLLSRILQIKGYKVHTVYGGLQAIKVAEDLRPKVIIMDLSMPVMDGFETAQLLRQKSWGKDIMLIALSGHSHDEDKEMSRLSGFDTHLAKPVDWASLISLLS